MTVASVLSGQRGVPFPALPHEPHRMVMAHQRVPTLPKKQRKRSFVNNVNRKKDTSSTTPAFGRTLNPYRQEAPEGAPQAKIKRVHPQIQERFNEFNSKNFVPKLNQKARTNQRKVVRHYKPHGTPFGCVMAVPPRCGMLQRVSTETAMQAITGTNSPLNELTTREYELCQHEQELYDLTAS